MRERDVGPSTSIDGLALGAPINSRRSHGDRTTLRLGPDEWLISGPDVALAAMQREIAEALGPTFHVLVDVSHRHAAFTLEGDGVAAALNAGCPLDLDERTFPVGMATRTLLGKVEVILARVGDEPRFELLCWRSYARYLTAFLAEAAATLE
jgi:sarcosine oxidase subunit gamma